MLLYSHRYKLLREELIKLRLQAGLTQRDLSRKLKKAQPHISKVETGERYLDVIDFIAWVEAIDGDPAQLIGVVAQVRR